MRQTYDTSAFDLLVSNYEICKRFDFLSKNINLS